MATQTYISLNEYLHTSYRPDREYVDGEVRERNVGKWEHARVQILIGNWFITHETEWGVMTSTEQRTRVAQTRVRIPDVVVVKAGSQPGVLVDPPVLVVEVLSPDDTYADTQERAADYRKMGVSTIWIIDPKSRTGRMCIDDIQAGGDVWKAGTRLEVPGTPIFMELAEIFRYLDQPV